MNDNFQQVKIELPLDMQIAANIIRERNVILVKSIDSGNLVPHFYNENRYIADHNFIIISSFIRDEIILIFNYITSEENDKIWPYSMYSPTKKDIKLFKEIGYINTLTRNVIKIIGISREIIRAESDFDSVPYEINCCNGIVNLKTMEFLPHTPERLNRNIINANFLGFDFESKRNDIKPFFDGSDLFLQKIQGMLHDKTKSEIENKEVVDSFMEILASFLIGSNVHKLLFIILGVPDAGKSTLLNILLGIFSDYGTTFNNSALLLSSRTSNDIRPDLIALNGKRLLVGSESNKSGKFDTALIKQISGNDQISVRKPHRAEMINFTIFGKLLLVTNYCPKFSDLDDKAFLNRIVLIDFNNIPETIDNQLKEKLLGSKSRDGIFTYLVNKACNIVKNNKIFIHERFLANKQRILVNQNSTVSRFWNAHIRPHEGYYFAGLATRHPMKVLYGVMYVDFCQREKSIPEKLEEFGKQFKSIAEAYPAVTPKKGASNNFYVGFNVVDGRRDDYYRMLGNSIVDNIFTENLNFFFSRKN